MYELHALVCPHNVGTYERKHMKMEEGEAVQKVGEDYKRLLEQDGILELVNDAVRGRSLVAKRDIKKGETVLMETAFVWACKSDKHCATCLKPLPKQKDGSLGYPCPQGCSV